MIGFSFVVKKNSQNILVKSAKPPDYILNFTYGNCKATFF